MIPVTTRLERVVRDGLASVVRKLLRAGIPGIVLEAPDREHALALDAAALRDLNARVVGAIAPLAEAPSSFATIASRDATEAEAAALAIRATAAAVAPLGARSVMATIGAAGLAGEDALRTEVARPDADARALVAAWRAKTRPEREARAVGLCRALHGIARGIAPQRLLLLPSSDPLGFCDVETAGWVLDDLEPQAVGLALDSGWVWAGERGGGSSLVAFLERHASRLGFLLISDHDSRGCGEILPGAGRGDLAVLRDAIGKRTPRALRPDPRASLDDLLASVEVVVRRLGAVGDFVGW